MNRIRGEVQAATADYQKYLNLLGSKREGEKA
ncbi:hypothetical protein BCAR13_100047 [Paraburkholderia caribensis]|nr:hypothetical protein BCAR13_100047 [Paraburkholderia caribensis]